jgi:hypothetical protein
LAPIPVHPDLVRISPLVGDADLGRRPEHDEISFPSPLPRLRRRGESLKVLRSRSSVARERGAGDGFMPASRNAAFGCRESPFAALAIDRHLDRVGLVRDSVET